MNSSDVVRTILQMFIDNPIRIDAPPVHRSKVTAEEPPPVGDDPPAGPPHPLLLHLLPLEGHAALLVQEARHQVPAPDADQGQVGE